MSDLVGNPKDRFSHVTAHTEYTSIIFSLYIQKQDLPTKLSQLGAVSVLGTMATMISETTHNASVSQNAIITSSQSSRNMRELICAFGKEMKVNLHLSKPDEQK